MEKPILSIVICSKDRHEEVRKLIDSISTLKHRNFKREIVVVEESAEPCPIEGTIYYHLPVRNLGFGFARQKAVEVSHGSILVFIDDDCLPTKQWLDNLIDLFSSETVTAVGGGILPQSAGSVGKAIALLGFPAGGIPRLLECGETICESRTLSTGNLAVRRDALNKAGGFDISLIYGGEDQEIIQNLQGVTVFQPKSLVYHRQRESLSEVWRWFVRRGKAEYFVNRSRNRKKILSLLAPVRWSWSWRLLILACVAYWVGTIPLICLTVLYYIFLLVRIFVLNRRKSSVPEVELCRKQSMKLVPLTLAPIVRVVMDFGREWGRLQGLIEDMRNND